MDFEELIIKKEKINTSRQKKYLLFAIFFMFLMFFSSSYALLKNFHETDDVINFSTGKLNMSITNLDDTLILTELNDKFPESDELGFLNAEPIKLTLTNTGTMLIDGYDVKLVSDSDKLSTLYDIYIKYVISLDDGITYSRPDILSSNNNIIYTGYNLDVLESKTIYLKVWIDESSGNNSLNKEYYGEIIVDLYQKKDMPAEENGIYISDISYKSNIYADLNNSYIGSKSGTTLDSKITLSNSKSNSSITYNTTICNNSEFDYVYSGASFDLESMTNDDIVFSVDSNLNSNDILRSGECVNFNITFKYKDGVVASEESNELSSSLTFNFSDYRSFLNGAEPVLDYGLIPVTIDSSGKVTTIKEDDYNWYNYNEKQWANAVLVKENGTNLRSYYKNSSGIEVLESDILAYYVWIPRFSYKIWNSITTNDTEPNDIEIIFHGIDTIHSGSSVDEYLTHPAFWWNENNDQVRDVGEEIPGFWVGKFETSQGTSNSAGTGNPVILPNVSSWVSQTVLLQFQTILKFVGGTYNNSTGVVTIAGSSLYGTSDTTDVHMMKNSEWGAVAYLTNSIYGLGSNNDIRINNYYKNSSYMTGCGGASNTEGTKTTCAITYGESDTYPQSTTGNISGVFDMSGGAWDRLMGNYNNITKSSGLSKFPPLKYYDLFTNSSLTSCTYPICGGHALTETYEWYNDLMNYPNDNYPWFVRGGGYEDGDSAGIFNLGRNVGSSSAKSSTRATLIVKSETNNN